MEKKFNLKCNPHLFTAWALIGLALVALPLRGFCQGNTDRRPEGVVEIRLANPLSPPSWALAERALIHANEEAAKAFAEKYVLPNGYLNHQPHWGGSDGPDDVMENFWNWPLLYAIGGCKEVLDLYRKIWEGHIRQYTTDSMLYREFIRAFDWEHNSEHYGGFINEGLADPTDRKFQERAVRFASFYTGEDPTAKNYDPVHKVIRSVLNGSRGPKLEVAAEYWYDKSASRHPGSKMTLENFFGDWTNVKGDIPMNLHATSLVSNAYLLTGEQKYKDWLVEYVGAWADRTKANKGNIPGNIGLNGKVGEHWDGKWWAGIMGWDWPFGGYQLMERGPRQAMLNAFLITDGNDRFLDTLRVQMGILLRNRLKHSNGHMLPPDRYNDEKGWYSPMWSVNYARALADIYLHSFKNEDWERIEETKSLPFTHDEGAQKNDYSHEYEWLAYLKGENPGYPDRILRLNLERIRRHVKRIREDNSDPATWRSDQAHDFLPLGMEGLFHLMTGTATPHWGSGLTFGELRYFDPVNDRAGIPAEVGALVEKIERDRIVLVLVNTNPAESRELLLQAGTYGQHMFTAVKFPATVPEPSPLVKNKGRVESFRASAGEPKESVQVEHRFLRVILEPGCGGRLELGVRRHVGRPRLVFPWHGDSVPVR